MCCHSTSIDAIPPHVFSSNSVSSVGMLTKGTSLGASSVSSSNYSPWFMTRTIYSAILEALKIPASIGSPGSDGGVVEFCIYGEGEALSLSKKPSTGPSLRTTANLLAQCKFSLGTVAEEKKIVFNERPRQVTWGWCVTRRFHNFCGGRAFSKCALTTADGSSFLRITEHCATCTRLSRCHIGGVVRIMFLGWGSQ